MNWKSFLKFSWEKLLFYVKNDYFHKLPFIEKESIIREITYENYSRIRIFSFLLAIINTLVIFLVDIPDLQSGPQILHKYYELRLALDIFISTGSLMLGIIINALSPQEIEYVRNYHKILNIIYVSFILAISTMVSILGQMENAEIITSVYAILGTAILIRFRLTYGLFIYIGNLLCLISGLYLIQKNPVKLSADIVNGSIITVIGIFISRSLFYARVNDILKRKTIEKQTQELQHKAISLEALNRELHMKTIELEMERKSLKERNKIIENDLTMARKIQIRLVPREAPLPNIATYYRPMDKVGGDFYDFILIPSSKEIGIFISDVSGHGVPAAFISAMIKSTLLEAGTKIKNPADILSHLNEIFHTQIGENFITALYGIYNPVHRTFTYANAGHNLPYLINKESIETISSKNRSIPLGIINPEKLEKETNYSNLTIKLYPDSKLLIYTDGLTEAIGSSNPMEDFESTALLKVFRELKHLPAKSFVEELIKHLIKFKGSEPFEDDVCVICIDV